MKTKIYSLSHPITKEIRYIGKTTKKLKRRLIEHISTGKKNIKNHKESWICNICKNNLKPEIELIEEVESNEWEFWEKFWICQFKCWGFNLVNGTDGGISPFETFKIKELNKKFISKIKSKKVIQYDLKGNFIKIWDNITKASENDKSLRKHISCCCLGKRKSAGGFMWKYYVEDFQKNIKEYEIKHDLSGLEKGREMSRIFNINEINTIRNLYANENKTLKYISKQFNVSITSIHNIIKKKSYKNNEN